MQMALSNLPRAHVHVACTPRRTSCFRSPRAVAATAQEVAPAQQLSKPAPHGRLYNFAAGPAVLPVEVLEEAQQGLLNWKGSGTSVMEMSHRGKEFSTIIQQAEDDLRSLLNIPDNYQVCVLAACCQTSVSLQCHCWFVCSLQLVTNGRCFFCKAAHPLPLQMFL